MKEYTYFNSKILSFQDKDSEMIMAPMFVRRSAKNYRFDHTRQILQKKCISCGEYFDVQKLENGKFIDVHDELVIHYFSEESGYATRCVSCNDVFNKETDKNEQIVETSQTDVILTQDNLMYVKIVAVLENKTKQECLNDILDIVRKHNTLSYEYKKNIK